MKKINGLILLLAFFLSGCRFDVKPIGVYTGTYTASNFGTSSGSATFTIQESSSGYYNVVFSAPGNPDLIGSDIEISRLAYYHGNTVLSTPEYSNPYPFQIFIDDYNTGGHWQIHMDYYAGSTSINFEGTKQ